MSVKSFKNQNMLRAILAIETLNMEQTHRNHTDTSTEIHPSAEKQTFNRTIHTIYSAVNNSYCFELYEQTSEQNISAFNLQVQLSAELDIIICKIIALQRD